MAVMLPREFYQLTMQEMVWARKGRMANELNDLRKIRFVAYASAAGFLKQGTTIEKFLPLEDDAPEKTAKDYQQIIERYKAAGYLKDSN